MPKRRRLSTGIYADANGIAVVYSVNGRPKETRFPKDKPLEQLVRWRTAQIGRAADTVAREPRGSLARDIVRYLKRLKGLPGYGSEKSHLHAWIRRLPAGVRRWQITREQVELAIADWRQEGYAARTIRHRCRVLRALFVTLDGARAETPVDDVRLPPKPKPRPVTIADSVIAEVALQLRKQEMPGIRRLHDAKTRARFLVLATTGRRPAEVMRARREDVDVHRRLWFTRTAKGGVNTVMALNEEMLAAWQLFIAAQAWGAYDTRSFSKTLKRNGWPSSVRPYNLRHSTGLAIRARGGDLEDVQDHLGHASIETARAFYLHALPQRQAAVSETLAGRFQPAAFMPLPRSVTTNRRGQDAKGRESIGKTTGSDRGPETASEGRKKRKEA